MTHRNMKLGTRLAAIACLATLALACSTDSPTAPEQIPVPPPPSGGNNVWTITISVDPADQILSSTQPSIVNLRVRRTGGGGPPPSGTTIVLSTSLGEFESLGSGLTSVALTLVNGLAQTLLFPGDIIGNAVLVAQLEGSVGRGNLSIQPEETLFLTGLSPNSGGESGGTRVTITGTGFAEPLQVLFGGIPASVVNVANDGTFVRVDTPRVFDPDSFFDIQACDADGDGVEDGEQMIPTRVTVQVTLREGTVASGSLANAFTYFPNDSSCQEAPAEPEDPFILSVTPNTGPAAGGTVVTITGRGFAGPNQLRVFFQNKLATVLSANRKNIVVSTPPGDLATVTCDDDNDGTLGLRVVDTPVQILVELNSGASESLANAFTYLAPGAPPCIGD